MPKIIIANWKMNKTVKQSLDYVKKFKPMVKDAKNTVVLCPSYTSIYALSNELKGTKIKLGAQDVFYENEGAFTGAVSCSMIKEFCDYVIIGHSERRTVFNEDNKMINKKLKAALANGLAPVLCVGETLSERQGHLTEWVVSSQLRGALEDINEKDAQKIIIAYEPVWAIGGKESDSPEDAEEVHLIIKGMILKKYSKETAKKIIIIYGGSVNEKNIKKFAGKKSIDGFLVGMASWEPSGFSKIVKSC